jgi:hypothetical protein
MPQGRPAYTSASIHSKRVSLHEPRAATVHTRMGLQRRAVRVGCRLVLRRTHMP